MILTNELLNRPGLYTANDLRAAAKEIETFLVSFRHMQSIFGTGLSEGMMEHSHAMLHRTARIIEERSPDANTKIR